MNEVYEFLKKCGTYYLATVENGRARVRPFGTVLLYEGKIYIQTGKRKAVADQMKAAPGVELCCFDGKTWLRLSGTAVLDERIEVQTAMLADYPELSGMYRPGDGNTEVYYLRDAEARFCSFTSPERVVRF